MQACRQLGVTTHCIHLPPPNPYHKRVTCTTQPKSTTFQTVQNELPAMALPSWGNLCTHQHAQSHKMTHHTLWRTVQLPTACMCLQWRHRWQLHADVNCITEATYNANPRCLLRALPSAFCFCGRQCPTAAATFSSAAIAPAPCALQNLTKVRRRSAVL